MGQQHERVANKGCAHPNRVSRPLVAELTTCNRSLCVFLCRRLVSGRSPSDVQRLRILILHHILRHTGIRVQPIDSIGSIRRNVQIASIDSVTTDNSFPVGQSAIRVIQLHISITALVDRLVAKRIQHIHLQPDAVTRRIIRRIGMHVCLLLRGHLQLSDDTVDEHIVRLRTHQDCREK